MTTEHEATQALLPAYALDVTDRGEQRSVEAHLRRCAACRATLADYLALGDDLAYALPAVTAPRHLEAQLRRKIAPVPRAAGWWTWLGGWRAPALAALLILLIGANFYWLDRAHSAEQQVAVLAGLTSAAGVPLPASAAEADSRGIFYRTPDGRLALLCVYELPPLPEGKVYQAWLVRGNERDSGGLFQVTPRGDGILVIGAARPLADYTAIGVTVEPAGGSSGPTSPRVIGGPL